MKNRESRKMKCYMGVRTNLEQIIVVASFGHFAYLKSCEAVKSVYDNIMGILGLYDSSPLDPRKLWAARRRRQSPRSFEQWARLLYHLSPVLCI